MAKKEESKVEEKGLEAIEMTAAQKEEFLEFLEKKEAEKIAKEDQERYKDMNARVNLKFSHSVNGAKFGPGRNINVPLSLLGILQQGENDMRDHELRMLTESKHTFEILQGGGGAIEVAGHRTPKMFG